MKKTRIPGAGTPPTQPPPPTNPAPSPPVPAPTQKFENWEVSIDGAIRRARMHLHGGAYGINVSGETVSVEVQKNWAVVGAGYAQLALVLQRERDYQEAAIERIKQEHTKENGEPDGRPKSDGAIEEAR